MTILKSTEIERNRYADFYLKALVAAYAAPELRLEVRPLHPAWREQEFYPDGDAPPNWRSRTPFGTRQWFALTPTGIQSAAAHARSLADRYDVYVGVLPRVGHTGKQENVNQTVWLWSDIDGGEEGVAGSYRLLHRSDLPTPHMIVVSGNGLHVYWRLAEIVDLPDLDTRFCFKMILKRLCNAIGGTSPDAHADSSRAEVASLLRVPGTLNNKLADAPLPVILDRFVPDAEAHTLTWWRANLPAIPAPPPPPPLYTAHTATTCDGLLRWAHKPLLEGQRHRDLVSAAAWLVRELHIEKGVALELLTIKAAVSPGTRQIARSELEGMIQWA